MSVPQLRAYKAENEASEMFKKYDKNGGGVLTKEEPVGFFHHIARGSTQLNDHRSASKIPEANNDVAHKLNSNVRIKPKKQLANKSQNFPTKVLDGKASNMPLSREHIKEIFKFHDSDKDGFLNIKELTKAFGSLGSIIPLHKAHYGLSLVDANNDGLVGEDELDKLIDYAYKVTKKK